MARGRTGEGDPARTLHLLWRAGAATPPRRGPQRGLDVDAVVDAAVALADDRGLDAVTVRRVADSLGVAPMTLYTYVPGKAELLDLMVDAAYLRMTRTTTRGRPWRDRLRAVAQENRALFAVHPWLVAVATLRPPLGPGQLAKYEHELAALDGLGLDEVTHDACLTHLLLFVQAAAQAEADASSSATRTGRDDAAWWAEASPLLARVTSDDRYPLAARVGTASGVAQNSALDPQAAWAFGLDRVVDGLAAVIEPLP